jgi:DNA-binding transcriptional LysR family regulator
MDKLVSMATLVKVAEAGSFSAAAKQLGVPLATVSRRVADLEAHLETRMLNRSSRRLSLTDAGRAYVDASRRILDQVEETEGVAKGLHGGLRGRLTVTAPIVFGRTHLIPVIAAFLAAFPDIDVKLALSDSLLNLSKSEVDLALRIGDLGDSSLVAVPVGSVRRVTCASPAYLARRGRPGRPEDLRDHACVTFDNLASPELWRFAAGDGSVVVPVRSCLTVTTAEAALAGAVAGLGLTRLLSYQIAEAREAGQLALVLESFEPAAWPVNLVYAGQPLQPAKLRAFVEFAAPRLRARLLAETETFAQ